MHFDTDTLSIEIGTDQKPPRKTVWGNSGQQETKKLVSDQVRNCSQNIELGKSQYCAPLASMSHRLKATFSRKT